MALVAAVRVVSEMGFAGGACRAAMVATVSRPTIRTPTNRVTRIAVSFDPTSRQPRLGLPNPSPTDPINPQVSRSSR